MLAAEGAQLLRTNEQGLTIQTVSAHWLKKQLQDPLVGFTAQEVPATEGKLLEILSNTTQTARECEKRLIKLLTPKRIELIKTLVKHRHAIFFGVVYNQAQTDEEKAQVEERMKNTPEGRQLLMELKLGRAAEAQ